MPNKSILLTIYDHPDKFPPTLNAIHLLSKKYEKVIILWRGTYADDLELPQNCITHCIRSKDLITSPYFTKLIVLLKFVLANFQLNRKYSPQWIICYDIYSFVSATILKSIFKSKKIWYHNHDVTDLKHVKKYSLTYFCWKLEQKLINFPVIFSVPDESRLRYFPSRLKGTSIVVPNYPLKNFNDTFETKHPKIFKILYQGRVAEGHGIEEFIHFIRNVKDTSIQLHIIGSYNPEFKEKLVNLIRVNDLKNEVILHERIARYEDLKCFTKDFDIGLGVMEPLNIQFQTCATASNKIYEYTAFAMPVILFDSPHFRNALERYRWAFFTDLSTDSIQLTLKKIMSNFDDCRQQAYLSFKNELNFETVFEKIESILD